MPTPLQPRPRGMDSSQAPAMIGTELPYGRSDLDPPCEPRLERVAARNLQLDRTETSRGSGDEHGGTVRGSRDGQRWQAARYRKGEARLAPSLGRPRPCMG